MQFEKPEALDHVTETDEQLVDKLLNDNISMYPGSLVFRIRRYQTLLLRLLKRNVELESRVKKLEDRPGCPL